MSLLLLGLAVSAKLHNILSIFRRIAPPIRTRLPGFAAIRVLESAGLAAFRAFPYSSLQVILSVLQRGSFARPCRIADEGIV